MKEIRTRIIAICICSLLFTRCEPPKLSKINFVEREAKFYNLNKGDYVLDVGWSDNDIVDPYVSLLVNDLHFYMEYINLKGTGWADKNANHSFKQISNIYKINNIASFKSLNESEDTILLNTNSIDKVLLRDRMDIYKNLDKKVSEFFRILKPEGKLIVVQWQSPKTIKYQKLYANTPWENEESIIKYFSQRNFKFISSRTYNLGGVWGNKLMVHFEKGY